MDEDIRQHLDARHYHEAMGLLVDRYQHKVFHLALSLMHDQGLAEDMAQETFVKVWRGLPGYAGQASLSTWIYAITRNTCLTSLKRLASRPGIRLEESHLEQLAAGSQEAPDGLTGMDVAAMLARLPERYRQALTLYYLEEKSYQEVAAMLGIPVGTVKTFLHRAKKELVRMGQGQQPTSMRSTKGAPSHGLS